MNRDLTKKVLTLGVALLAMSASGIDGGAPSPKESRCQAVRAAEEYVSKCGLSNARPPELQCAGVDEFSRNTLDARAYAAYQRSAQDIQEWVVVFRYSEASMKDLRSEAQAAANAVARTVVITPGGQPKIEHVEVKVSRISSAERAAARCTDAVVPAHEQ